MGRIATSLRCRRGTSAVEFALIAPTLLLLTGGIIEFGSAFQSYKLANQLATQYAITWADCSDSPAGTCQTELTAFSASNTLANIAPQLKASSLTLRMFQVKMTGTTPGVTYASPSGATLSADETTAAQAAFSNGQSGVVVSVAYTHAPIFASRLLNPAFESTLTASYTVTQLKS